MSSVTMIMMMLMVMTDDGCSICLQGCFSKAPGFVAMFVMMVLITMMMMMMV